MKIDVETIGSDCEGFDRIASIASSAQGLLFDSIELDFSSSDYFEANMAAPLYTVIARLYSQLNAVSVVNMPDEIRKILRKNKFLNIFNQSELTDTNRSTLPFKIFKLVANEQFNDYLDLYMKDRGMPAMSDALSNRYKRSLFEIFLNAAIHSESQFGIFVCGQFYRRKRRMDFTIADAGIGIRENVRQYTDNPALNSCDAIEWAMVDGHTTKTGIHPGGLGFKLIREFIRMNGGKIQVVSRFGYYEFSAESEFVREMTNDFPGTCINIEINTSDKSQYRLKSEITREDIF